MKALKEIVARYNELATTLGKPEVKRFADRKAADRRLAKLEAEFAATQPAPAKLEAEFAATQPAPAKKEKAPKHVKGQFRDRVMPAIPELQGKFPKPDSLAGLCLAMLTRPQGASLDEVIEMVEEFDTRRGSANFNVYRRSHDLVDLMNRRRGYAMEYRGGRAYVTLDEAQVATAPPPVRNSINKES